MNEEIAFDNFLDSEEGDRIFAALQLEIKKLLQRGIKRAAKIKNARCLQ